MPRQPSTPSLSTSTSTSAYINPNPQPHINSNLSNNNNNNNNNNKANTNLNFTLPASDSMVDTLIDDLGKSTSVVNPDPTSNPSSFGPHSIPTVDDMLMNRVEECVKAYVSGWDGGSTTEPSIVILADSLIQHKVDLTNLFEFFKKRLPTVLAYITRRVEILLDSDKVDRDFKIKNYEDPNQTIMIQFFLKNCIQFPFDLKPLSSFSFAYLCSMALGVKDQEKEDRNNSEHSPEDDPKNVSSSTIDSNFDIECFPLKPFQIQCSREWRKDGDPPTRYMWLNPLDHLDCLFLAHVAFINEFQADHFEKKDNPCFCYVSRQWPVSNFSTLSPHYRNLIMSGDNALPQFPADHQGDLLYVTQHCRNIAVKEGDDAKRNWFGVITESGNQNVTLVRSFNHILSNVFLTHNYFYNLRKNLPPGVPYSQSKFYSDVVKDIGGENFDLSINEQKQGAMEYLIKTYKKARTQLVKELNNQATGNKKNNMQKNDQSSKSNSSTNDNQVEPPKPDNSSLSSKDELKKQ